MQIISAVDDKSSNVYFDQLTLFFKIVD